MAVQKHNTYYDNELYYYDENGERKPLQVGKIYSAGSGIKIENDVISVSGKYVASASTSLDNKRLVLVNNEWTELIIPSGSDWSQTIQEASAYAYSAATAWTDSQGYLTAHQIIPSAKWENASDIVETNSAKWNDGYNTLSSNSGNWVKKEELYSVSSTLNTNKLDISSFDEYKDLVNEELDKKQDKSAMSAYAFSSWVDENYQKKGNYLSANALDLISDTSGKWNEVSSKLDENDFTAWSANYDEYVKSIENDVGNLKSNSSNWDSVYNNVNTNSAKWDAASDEVTSHSANWNNVYESVHTNSGDWEEITKVKTFKTICGIEAKTSADSLEFSAGENIEIGINEGKIFISSYDTTYDENDFISASHLDNIESVSATVNTNSADWTSAARALEASADKWNTTHEQVNTSSVKWNELYNEYQVSSKLWNDTTNTVKTLSGELKTTSSFLSGSIDGVSGEFKKVVYTSATENWDVTPYSAGKNINITNHTISGKDWTDTIEEASANAVTIVENKFNGENGTITAYGTSSFANDKYTAGEGLALNDNQFYVSGKYITSAGDSLSGKMLVLKDNKWAEMPEFGGFATANSGVSHPDVQNPSTKLIYLVKDSKATGDDKYSEWIYTSAEQTTAWECIGDTSLDLTPYLTKTSASENLAPLSVTADIESLKKVSGDFSLYYNKNETSSKNELSSEFVKYVTTTEFNGVNVDVSTLKSASSEWNKVDDKLDTTAFRDVSGNFLTAAPENMATTGEVAELAQTISETYQRKGDYLTTADRSNFYPSNNPSGFITGVDLSNYYNKTETSSKNELDTAFGSKQDNLTKEQLSAISSVSSIKGTVLVGDSNILAASAEDGNNIKWTLELTAQPTVTDTTLSGYNGIVATKDSTVSSQWNVGIEQAYKEQIEAVSSKLTQDVADTLYAPISVIEDVGTLKTASAGWNKVSDKLDTTSFSDVSGKFLTAHQDISNKLDTTAFSAVSGNFLTEDNLNAYATKIDLENTSGKLLTTAQYKTDSATFLTAHQNLDAYATKEYANNASANALSQAKTWVESQNYLKEVPNTYATKTDLNTASSTLTGVDNALSGHINYVSAHTITSLDNYYTKTQVDSTFASATQLNNYLTTSQYNTDSGTFALKTEIPKTVSQLTDSGNYYQKTDTSGKTELTNALNTKVDKPSQTGKLVYDGDNNEWVTLPEGTTTIVQGQGSITSNYDASNSTYTVSLLASAENALNKVDDKIDTTAVEQTYQTKEDMSNYLTINDASTTYQVTGDYVTQSDISDMATQTWVGQQGFYTKASGDNDYAPKTITATVNTLTGASASWNEVSAKLDSSVASTTYQTKADMEGYLTKNDASTTYQPTGNYLVANDITGKLDKSIYENASGNWENTYNTVKQYSAAGTWLTAHQSLEDYYKKTETSSTTQLSTEFAKYVTSGDITPDIDYVMTTTGWKELTLPGGGMTQVIHDETLTGQGNANNSKLGLAQTAYNAITSVSSKLDTSAFSTVSSTFLTKSSADNDYAPISITATVNTLTAASAGWNEVSAKLGTAQYATDSAKFVTSSSNTITGTKQYALTTTGWAEVSTHTVPDITATSGISADGFSIGLTNTAIGAITSVSSKVDIPDTTQTDLNNNYLIYSTLTDPGATTGWMPLSANYYSKSETNGIFVSTANIDNTTLSGDGKSSDTKLGVKTDVIATKDYVNSSFLPLSGGTVSGEVTVSSSGTCLLSVGTEDTLMGQSRVVNIGDTTAIGTNWLGVSQSNQGFLKYVNGGDVGALNGTSIQINFAPDGANSYGNITVNSQNNMSKVINVPTASYNSMSSFDSTNGPNYMLRKTASGFDIGAAVINVTELPQQIEANAYYFVYDT